MFQKLLLKFFFSFPPVNEDLLQPDSTVHVVTQLRTHDGK